MKRLICSFAFAMLCSAQTIAAETATCPDRAQVRQALDFVAAQIPNQADAIGKGDGTQLEALQRSGRIVVALIRYRDECLPARKDWTGDLAGDAPSPVLLDRVLADIDLIFKANTSMQRVRDAKQKLDEGVPQLQESVRRFLEVQQRHKAPKNARFALGLPEQLATLLDNANRIVTEETVDAEVVFLLGKGSNQVTQSIEEIPESFRPSVWGKDAKLLSDLAAEIRKAGVPVLIATGGILGNIQQLVTFKRAVSSLRTGAPKAFAEFATLIQ